MSDIARLRSKIDELKIDERDQCGNCMFWKLRNDTSANMGGGFCRRYPPQFLNGPKALNDGWPMTHQQSWCGEYRESRAVKGQ